MVEIPATALCPGIHPHAARHFCSALAVLGRLTELTAVLRTHIHLSFKQRDTHTKISSKSMMTNIRNPNVFAGMSCLSDMPSKC